jgi:PAS domain S-box-containing protein/putative nucleotidyltransferase with HDIG domain
MIVEDESVVALDIRHRLQNLGYDVAAVTGKGEESVELAGREKPDIVLMDIMLAGEMDGIEAARIIHEKYDIPVVYISSHTDDETLSRAKITEPFGYIIKPFEDREISTTIEMAHYKHEAERQKKNTEQWLATTLASISEGVLTVDTRHRITYMNRVAEKCIGPGGSSDKPILLGDVLNIRGEAGMNQAAEVVDQVLHRKESLSSYDVVLETFEGATLPIELAASPIINERGEVTGVVIIFRDITERQKARQDIIRSEARFRHLYENIPLGYFTLNENNELTQVNQAWLEMTGYSRHEVLGRLMGEFIPADDCKQIELDGPDFDPCRGREFKIRRKDGAERVVYTQGRRGHDVLHGTQQTYCVMQDVTDKRMVEEKIIEQNEFLNNIIESIPHPFYVVNAHDHSVERANSAARNVGEVFDTLLFSGNGGGPPSPLSVVKDTRAPVTLERSLGNGNGNSGRHVEIHAYPVFGKSGEEVEQVIEYAQDITERKNAEEALKKSVIDLRQTLQETVNALAVTSEKRDPYTAGHQQRVSKLACSIARMLGLSDDQIEGIRVASLLHDLGKIYIPAEILSKPAKLTNMEFGIMQTHPQVGYDILKRVPFPWPVADIVLQHHERLDGCGYPSGLIGKDILYEAKVIAVSDVVEAMSSHRPYRAAVGLDLALDEICRRRGEAYDADCVDACMELFRSRNFRFE